MTSIKEAHAQRSHKTSKTGDQKRKSTYVEVDPFLIQFSRKMAEEAQEKENKHKETA